METMTHNNFSFHTIKEPSKKDVSLLKESFRFHPSIISELFRPTLHPKIELYEDHVFLVLRFPQFDKQKYHKLFASEIDIIIDKNQLILVQYQNFKALDTLLEQLKTNEELKKEFFQNNPGYLLYKILDYLFRSLYEELDHIGKRVNDVEGDIFEGHQEKMLQSISWYRREAIDFKRIIKPNVEIFKELSENINKLFGADIAFYISSTEAVVARLVSLIENHVETLHIIHETNVSLLSFKANEIMKRLTIFAVIVFPLTFISSIWGMNMLNIPFSDHPLGFWIMVGIMLGGAISMLSFFKFKKWI